MARDHAQIRLDMWGDDDWRKLSVPAQHLYMLLLTSPSLSFCGVADWRPARIAQLAADWTTDDVLEAASELTDRLFLVIDDGTEEVLIRSFVRHDGLMKMPNMATAMATSHAGIASAHLRGVVVHELRRLHEKQPELAGWKSKRALAVLERDCIDPSVKGSPNPSVNPSGNPSVKGSVSPEPNPSVDPSVNPSPSPTPAPTPTPSTSNEVEKELGARKRATQAPDSFEVTTVMRKWASEKASGVDLEGETEKFLDHHRAKGTTFKDWTAAWRTWMSRAKSYSGNVRQLPTAARHSSGQSFADGTPLPWDR